MAAPDQQAPATTIAPRATATDLPAVTATIIEEVLETSAAPTRTQASDTATPRPTRTKRPTVTSAPPTTAAPTDTIAPAFTATSVLPTQPPPPTVAPTELPPPTQPPVPTAAPTQPPPANLGYTCPNGGLCIKGNINSEGRRLYHYPGCRSYNQTEIDISAGERWFNNEAEAQAAGWERAGNC